MKKKDEAPVPEQIVDEIFSLLSGPAGREEYGENVTQRQHALQCAHFAACTTDDEETIIAALLHDIGHLCDDTAEQMGDGDLGTVDHEALGAAFLRARGFSEKVAELVAAHVAAKRYLVATNSSYAAQLSAASAETLKHQGGPMSAAEVAAFEADPLFRQKLRMRFWDERGKEPHLEVPPLESYRAMLVRHLRQQERAPHSRSGADVRS